MTSKICSELRATEQPGCSVERGEGQGEAHGVEQMLLGVFVLVNYQGLRVCVGGCICVGVHVCVCCVSVCVLVLEWRCGGG